MSATVEFRRLYSTGPSALNVFGTTARLDGQDSDDNSSVTSAPVPIPSSSTNQSYFAVFRCYVSGGTFTNVSNFRFYTNGTNSLGTGLTSIAQVGTTYTQPSGSGNIGTTLNSSNVPSLVGSPVNTFSFTSSSPANLGGSTSTTGYVGNYLYIAILADSTASSGAATAQTFTVEWDEI